MIHMYCCIHNIKDTSRGESYHNNRFGKVASKFGGFVGKYKYGYRISGLDQEIKDEIYRHNINYDTKQKFRITERSKNNTRKYMCSCCGSSFRATRDINVLCIDCNKQYEIVKTYQ